MHKNGRISAALIGIYINKWSVDLKNDKLLKEQNT